MSKRKPGSMATHIHVEEMSPYITDLLSEDTLRKGGITLCDYALKKYPPECDVISDEARELARTLLEAFGYIPISLNVPLTCGHIRQTKPSEKLYHHGLCPDCDVEKRKNQTK